MLKRSRIPSLDERIVSGWTQGGEEFVTVLFCKLQHPYFALTFRKINPNDPIEKKTHTKKTPASMKQPFSKNGQCILPGDLELTKCVILPDVSRVMASQHLLFLPQKWLIINSITEVKL